MPFFIYYCFEKKVKFCYNITMKKKVYLIEDDSVILYGLRAKLQSEGLLTSINDGTKNLEETINDIKLAFPNYIILDLILPNMDGFDLLRALKSDSELGSLPMFIFTNYSDSDTKKHCKHLGVDFYYIKSELNIDEFVQKVLKIINNMKF